MTDKIKLESGDEIHIYEGSPYMVIKNRRTGVMKAHKIGGYEQ